MQFRLHTAASARYFDGGYCFHVGAAADERMTDAARVRNITLTSRSRPVTPQDLADFDYIIGMDHENIAAIHRAATHWATSKGVAADYTSKVFASEVYHGTWHIEAAAPANLLHDSGFTSTYLRLSALLHSAIAAVYKSRVFVHTPTRSTESLSLQFEGLLCTCKLLCFICNDALRGQDGCMAQAALAPDNASQDLLSKKHHLNAVMHTSS